MICSLGSGIFTATILEKKFFHWEDDYNPYEFDQLLEHLYDALSIAHEVDALLHIYLETLAFHNEHLSNRPYEYPSIYLPQNSSDFGWYP